MYDEPPEPDQSSSSQSKLFLSNFSSPDDRMPDDQAQSFVRTLYRFRGENSNELSFDANRVICLHGYFNEEWAFGELDGVIGLFPVNFTESIENEQSGSQSQEESGSIQNVACVFDSIGVAEVLHDFNSRETDELSVGQGETVTAMYYINAEWVMCHSISRNESGMVPLTFLKFVLNAEEMPVDSEIDHVPSLNQGSKVEIKTNYYSLPPSHGEEQNTSVESDISVDASLLDSFFGFSSELSVPNLFPSSGNADVPFLPAKSTSQKVVKREPPARPPPPQKWKLNAFVPANVTGVVEQDKRVQKQRTVHDLINTELQYLSDIGIWEAVVNQSSLIGCSQKSALTSSLPRLRQLSRLFVQQICEEQNSPEESQSYGLIFIKLRDEFNKAFGSYFRNTESIRDLINGKNREMQNALNACLNEMRTLGCNVFDIPAVISRPIQRCLKYPLFISELLKNTSLTHLDHPRLLEAQKQMVQLASRMNEFKRRKEITEKYKNVERESFSTRLSKINIHTIKKKSNRFKYRFSSQFGLIQLEKDQVFDGLIEKLDTFERIVCKFLHALQCYRKFILIQSKRYVDVHTTVERFAANPDNVNASVRIYCKDILEKSFAFSKYLNDKIAPETRATFLRLPVARLIQKRYDKFLDYMSAKKEGKSDDEIHIKKCDYDALNNQLKVKLPNIILDLTAKMLVSVETFMAKDDKFFKDFDYFSRLNEEASVRTYVLPFRLFVDSSNSRLNPFLKISKAVAGVSQKIHEKTGDSSSVKGHVTSVVRSSSTSGAHASTSGTPPLHQNQQKKEETTDAAIDLIDLDLNLLDLNSPITSFPSTITPVPSNMKSVSRESTVYNAQNEISSTTHEYFDAELRDVSALIERTLMDTKSNSPAIPTRPDEMAAEEIGL